MEAGFSASSSSEKNDFLLFFSFLLRPHFLSSSFLAWFVSGVHSLKSLRCSRVLRISDGMGGCLWICLSLTFLTSAASNTLPMLKHLLTGFQRFCSWWHNYDIKKHKWVNRIKICIISEDRNFTTWLTRSPNTK